MSYFGCFTGDCPHMDEADCLVAIEAHCTKLEDQNAGLHDYIQEQLPSGETQLIQANIKECLSVYRRVVAKAIQFEERYGISECTRDILRQAVAFHPLYPESYPECLSKRAEEPNK